MLIKKNQKYILFIFPIISLIGGAWQGQFTDDGYHWGFIFSNALDLLNGKIPYKEIFIEYGLLSTLLHSIIIKIFDKNIFSLIILTCFFYSISIYFIGKIIQEITKNNYYSFLGTGIIFFIYPWPVTPWPHFISFLLSILFLWFYLKEKKRDFVIAGLMLGLAYLSYTTVYNFIIIFFILLTTAITFIVKKKNLSYVKKNIFVFISFLSVIIIFFLYLKINGITNIWFNYQTIPFILSNYYDISIYSKIQNYINFLIFYSVVNFINEPQFIIYSIFFFSNLYILYKIFISIYYKEKCSIEKLNLLTINVFILSLNIYAQILDIDKLATSIALGIIPFMYILSFVKSNDNKIIVNFIIIFISFYSLFLVFNLEGSKLGGSRAAYFKDIKNTDIKYKNTEISYFKNQKWSVESWLVLDKFLKIQDKVSSNCKIEFAANLTTNTFIYSLFNYKTMQLIPFFFKNHGHELRKQFEPNLINNIQKQIDINNILIVSFENNDKLFNLEKYSKPQKININAKDTNIAEYIYIYYPNKCN